MKRKLILGVGLVALIALPFFLSGCEEEDVGAAFRGNGTNVSASEAETLAMAFEVPLILTVDTSNGGVTVKGVEGIQTASVTITRRSRGETLAEAQERVARLVVHAEQAGNRITLRYCSIEQEADVRRHSGVDFDVLVPVDARVQVDTSNGAIVVEGIDGTIALDTSNGAIDVYDSMGDLTADTSNGRIEVVRFVGDLRLDTSNGEVWIEDVTGTVSADTSNGSVHYSGTPTAGRNRIDTSNGSVTVRVPMDASIAFEVDVGTGRIRSSLPLVGDTEGDEWSAQLNPPAELTFDLRASNGTIRIEGGGG